MKIKLFAAVLAATICMASVTPQAEAGSRATENFLSGKESGSVGSTATGDKGSGTDIIAQLLAAVQERKVGYVVFFRIVRVVRMGRVHGKQESSRTLA